MRGPGPRARPARSSLPVPPICENAATTMPVPQSSLLGEVRHLRNVRRDPPGLVACRLAYSAFITSSPYPPRIYMRRKLFRACPSQTELARFAENRRSRMPYHSDFERCHMVEALQAQARFCDELACACLDQTHAEDFKRKADKYRAAAVLISSNE